MSDAADLKPLIETLIVLVEGVAKDVTALRTDLAEIKAVQVRHSSRLALIDTYLDEQGQTLDGLLRP